jgi:hypothetical protein
MTFVLTVLADLIVAAEIGMLFVSLLYIYRFSQTTTVAPVTEEYIEDGRPHVLQRHSHSLLLPWVPWACLLVYLSRRDESLTYLSLPLQ